MNHIAAIAARLEEFGLDSMLICSDSGERYALGFHGEGLLLITRDGAHYSTDGRYIEAAEEQVTGTKIVCTSHEKTHTALAAEFIQKAGLKKTGFEDGELAWKTVKSYQEKLPTELIPAQNLISELRASKDADELACMRRAQKITDESFLAILDYIRPGQTEQEIAARLVYEMMRRGGEKVSFDPIVAAGPSGSRPHAVPTERKVENGMFITMDFGCKWNGYCSDMTRTVALGKPTEEMRQVYAAVLAAQEAGISVARAGIPGKEVDAAARRVLDEAGYGEYFAHSFGHSLGLDIHEKPNAARTEETPLPCGAVISAEPGIYIPGRFGVRVEDVIVIQEDGCFDVTRSPKQLLIL